MDQPLSHWRIAQELIRSRKFLIAFASLVALLSPLALISNSAGDQKEGYLTMITLGSSMKADDYFPSANNTVNLSEPIKWYIKVYNGMDKSEYLSLRLKLLNSTQTIPDDVSNTPSPVPELIEYRQLISKQSEVIVPLEWKITDIDKGESVVTIRELMINGERIDNLDINSINGQNFRIVLELWKYESDSGDFSFVWSSNNKEASVWNQIWFNIKN
ncbi:MAG: hypothetical protein HMLIMOIP_001328 [Candidatus Nitrosomirales archaeon]|jgi:hypothetical protein